MVCLAQVAGNGKYELVEKRRAIDKIDLNEVRVTSQGRTPRYIDYALSLLREVTCIRLPCLRLSAPTAMPLKSS